jgi:Rrf2 family protein
MQLNITTDYAIRVLLCLLIEDRPVGATEIAQKAKVPKAYLTFIMSKMKQAGFVSARRGQIGGYCLIKAPQEITLWDVIQVMERSSRIIPCMTDGYHCDYANDTAHCPLRTVFYTAQKDIEEIFHRVTLEDLRKHHMGEGGEQPPSQSNLIES